MHTDVTARLLYFFYKFVIAISIKIYNKHKIQIKNTLVTAPAGRSCRTWDRVPAYRAVNAEHNKTWDWRYRRVPCLEEGWREKQRQRSSPLFGGQILFNSLTASCFASVGLEETFEFIPFFQIVRGKTASAARNFCFSLHPSSMAPFLFPRQIWDWAGSRRGRGTLRGLRAGVSAGPATWPRVTLRCVSAAATFPAPRRVHYHLASCLV